MACLNFAMASTSSLSVFWSLALSPKFLSASGDNSGGLSSSVICKSVIEVETSAFSALSFISLLSLGT